jgi:hypothetical protein
MSLFKRHIGRRVTVVGVGVALLVLGLEAPAFAALGITGFTPASGPTNCVVVITGTDFQNPNVTGVSFGATVAPVFAIQSDTEIWVSAPAASGFITLTKAATGETVSSSTQYTGTGAAPGDCAPTITNFAPKCGVVGTTVTIDGTNLIDGPGLTGAVVEFSPFTAAGVGVTATHTGAAETPAKLVVNVPVGAGDGRIQVTTDGGSPFSADSFDVVTDPADCAAAVPFARNITLRLRDALVARGKVTAAAVTPPAPAECTAAVPVKIQRRVSGHWKTVGKTTTSDTGAYRKKIRNRHGKYRSLAPSVTLASGDVCARAKSKVVRH